MYSFSFINCLLILIINFFVLAIVGSDMFVCSLLCMYSAILAISKATQLYIYSALFISCLVSFMCTYVFFFQIE